MSYIAESLKIHFILLLKFFPFKIVGAGLLTHI